MSTVVLPETSAEAGQRVVGGSPAFSRNPTSWRRPSDWLDLSISASDEKFVGLVAVTDDGSNYLALTAGGNYTVDWGDGTVENVSAATQAQHLYSYSSLSAGTASSRGYRQAIVTVVPQAGAQLSTVDLNAKHTGFTAAWPREAKWLDVAVAGPNLTSFLTTSTVAGVSNIYMNWLERARVLASAISAWDYAFANCSSLRSVQVASSAAATSTPYMFSACYALKEAPPFDMSSVTNMNYMFSNCHSLERVPGYRTGAVTTMRFAFQSCLALEQVPLLDTSSATDLTSTFIACSALRELPAFDLSSATLLNSTFQQCTALREVPQFDMSSATNVSSFYNSCRSLRSVPAMNTSAATTMTSVFFDCASLTEIASIDTSSATTITSMFYGCRSLQAIPYVDASKVTTAPTTSPVNLCYSLGSAALNGLRYGTVWQCSLSTSALEAVFDGLGAAWGSQTATVTGNPGADSVALSGTTTSGSTTITMASTTGLQTGMEISGTGISDAVAVTVQDAGDTFTRASHGLSDGTRVGVLTLNGAGVGVKRNTPYYVVNSTTNTFQLADAAGGSAKAIQPTPKFTGLTSGSSSTDATTYATASVTLTAGRLYLLSVENSHGTSASAVSAITGGAGVPTFTSRLTTQFNTNLNRLSVWSAVPSSDYTGTLTINFGGVTQTGGCWSLVEVVNADTSAADGVVASSTSTGATASSASLTATAVSATTNALFGVQAHASTTLASPIGRHVEIHEVTAATPTQELQTMYASCVDDDLDQTVGATAGSLMGAWGLGYLEIKGGTSTADGAGTINYGTTISSITTNTSVVVSAPASASGTVTTTSSVLKRSKARMRGFTVSG